MERIIIALGNDHRGVEHARTLCDLDSIGTYQITWHHVGTDMSARTDYPIYAKRVVHALQTEQATFGILICGSGAGMAICANRTPHIYAAVAWNPEVARMVRADDHCNTLVIPSDFVTPEETVIIVNEWLSTQPKGGRYRDRLAMIDS